MNEKRDDLASKLKTDIIESGGDPIFASGIFSGCHNGWDACKKEYENKLDKLKAANAILMDALEYECGNRCDAHYNPCNSREALDGAKKIMNDI